MREALLIFRKDAYHRRTELCAFLLLVVVRTAIDIVLPRHPDLVLTQGLLGILLAIAAVGLIYSTVQQERVRGVRQYWVTRPLPWRSILAAKLLFGAAFIMLPLFLGFALALALNGVAPSSLASLLLTGALGLLLIAVASVTRSTVHFLLTVLVYLMASVLSGLLEGRLFGYESSHWGAEQGVRTNVEMLILTVAAAYAILRQYQRRSPRFARALLAAAAAISLIGLPGWRLAFAYREATEGPGAAAAIHIAFDPQRVGAPHNWTYLPGEDVVGVKIPVVITGIPDGAQLIGERVRTAIDAPGGRHWDSGWRSIGGIMGPEDPGAAPHRVTVDQPSHWLAINIDRSFYQAANLESTPVTLHAVVAFTSVPPPQTVRLPVPCLACRVPPGGFCSVTIHTDTVTMTCLWSHPEDLSDPARTYRFRQGAQRMDTSDSWSMMALSAWAVSSTSAVSPAFQPTEVEIETRKAAGAFERRIDVSGIRLGAFEVGRSTPARDLFEGVRTIQW